MNVNKEPLAWTSKRLPEFTVGKKEDLEAILNYLNLDHETNGNDTDYAVMKPEDSKLVFEQRNPIQQGITPNVKDMGLRDAIYTLEQAGLKVIVKGSGKVAAQSIKAYTPVSKGRSITILLK